jgi:hypothetical protein
LQRALSSSFVSLPYVPPQRILTAWLPSPARERVGVREIQWIRINLIALTLALSLAGEGVSRPLVM